MQLSEKIKKKINKTFAFAEKHLKTDMTYLAKGGFWLMLAQIATSALSFLLAIAFANMLAKETYGTYKFVLSLTGILGIFTLTGVGTAVIQAVGRGFESTLYPALKTKSKWGLLAGLASIALAAYYYMDNNNTLAISFLIAAAFLPLTDSFGIYDSYLTGKKLFKDSTKYKVIAQIISVAVLIITLTFTKNLFLILFAYFAPLAILNFIFFKITVKKFKPNKNIDPEAISYGKHLSLNNVLGIISAQTDKILVFHYLGVVDLAVYAFATAVPEQVKKLSGALAVLVFPKFSERSSAEIRAGIKNKFFWLFIFGSVIAIIYIILAPFIYGLFFPEYESSVFYSQIFSLSMLNIFSMPASVFLSAKKKIKEQYLINAAQFAFQMVSMFLLILWQGLLGLIVARLLTRFFGSVINLIFYYRVATNGKE